MTDTSYRPRRYLSTPLFADIPADMTAEEKEIFESTRPTFVAELVLPAVEPQATAFVKKAIADDNVVVFSLQSCEFCWTLFSLLNAIGVKHKVYNIDAFEFAKDNMGNKYRAALSEHTQCVTFPQLFINGEFVGGAIDACLNWKKGELQKQLKKGKVDFDASFDGDPFKFLPNWMGQNPHRTR